MLAPFNKVIFVVLALFFIGTAAFVLLDTFRGYQAEVSVIVLPLGSRGQVAADQMVENIARIPTTLHFYDTLLASNTGLTEFSSSDEQSDDQRLARWQHILTVTRQGKSGIITYTIQADNQEEAALLSRQITHVLIENIGVYYDIRSDVSLRVVTGPMVRATLVSPVLWVLSSLCLGFAVTFLLMFLVSIPRYFFSHKTEGALNNAAEPTLKTPEKSLPIIHPQTFIPKKPIAFFSESAESKVREETWEHAMSVQERHDEHVNDDHADTTIASTLPNTATQTEKEVGETTSPQQLDQDHTAEAPKNIVDTPTSTVTAHAPANLPFIDEATFLARFSAPDSSDTASSQTDADTQTQIAQPEVAPNEVHADTDEKPALTEPTMEDYRRRLNELLKEGR